MEKKLGDANAEIAKLQRQLAVQKSRQDILADQVRCGVWQEASSVYLAPLMCPSSPTPSFPFPPPAFLQSDAISKMSKENTMLLDDVVQTLDAGTKNNRGLC